MHYQKRNYLKIYGRCIMPNHIKLLQEVINKLEDIARDMKILF